MQDEMKLPIAEHVQTPAKRRRITVITPNTKPIHKISDTILLHLFEFFSGWNIVFSVSAVCKRWRRIILTSNELWQKWCFAEGFEKTNLMWNYEHDGPESSFKISILNSAEYAPLNESIKHGYDSIIQKMQIVDWRQFFIQTVHSHHELIQKRIAKHFKYAPTKSTVHKMLLHLIKIEQQEKRKEIVIPCFLKLLFLYYPDGVTLNSENMKLEIIFSNNKQRCTDLIFFKRMALVVQETLSNVLHKKRRFVKQIHTANHQHCECDTSLFSAANDREEDSKFYAFATSNDYIFLVNCNHETLLFGQVAIVSTVYNDEICPTLHGGYLSMDLYHFIRTVCEEGIPLRPKAKLPLVENLQSN